MHLSSVVRVSGVHCVIPKGRPTAGNVWPFSSEPASLCFFALSVVAGAVPISGSTYCTSDCAKIVDGKSSSQINNFIVKQFIDRLKLDIQMSKLQFSGINSSLNSRFSSFLPCGNQYMPLNGCYSDLWRPRNSCSFL